MRIVRYAAFGALGASAGLLALYLFIVLGTLPNRGGLDIWHSLITWISLGGVIALLMAIHLVYARHLLRYHEEGP